MSASAPNLTLPVFDGPAEQFIATARFQSARLVAARGTQGGWAIPVAHWQSRLGNDVCTAGYSHHTVILQRAGNDVRRVDNPRFASRRSAPGRILIIPAGMESAWRSSDISDRIHFYVRPALLHALARETTGQNASDLRDDRIFIRDDYLRLMLERYAAVAFGDDPSATLERDLLTLQIALRLLDRHSSAPPRVDPLVPPTDDESLRLRDIIEAHLSEPLTLERVATLAGTTPAALKRTAPRALGQSLHQYVLDRRLERARQLIAQGNPLAEVALECGFSSQSHMTNRMRARWGVTPGALRDLHCTNGRV
ncbi:MAG: AraC family transcriptional regulator [Alphaproteobacteria bacterium]|nr:MAG: AraC family transcriptional regulator [Alphaproteobacteria bacterium]